MDVRDIVAALRQAGAGLLIEGDRLIVESDAPLADERYELIRAHKPELLALLTQCTEAAKAIEGRAAMTVSEEAAIRRWLALIDETDPATISDVIDQCQRDADARDYFIWRAAGNSQRRSRGSACR